MGSECRTLLWPLNKLNEFSMLMASQMPNAYSPSQDARSFTRPSPGMQTVRCMGESCWALDMTGRE